MLQPVLYSSDRIDRARPGFECGRIRNRTAILNDTTLATSAAGRDARGRIIRALLVAACAVAGVLGAAGPAHAAGRLDTALTDGGPFNFDPENAFPRVYDAGARFVRVYAKWSEIAPAGTENETGRFDRPEGFEARNPADPLYDWAQLDRQVTAAAAAGLAPIVVFSSAPRWAELVKSDFRPGTNKPNPSDFGDFGYAAATRYSGAFGGLARVTYWQAWNEPNLFSFLQPQYDTPIRDDVTLDSKPLAPSVYRPMLNAFADAVRSVHEDNYVIAAGLAPFGRFEKFDHAVPPLQFMRHLLCLSDRLRPIDGCEQGVSFDAWATHPYTQGSPARSAQFPDNVSIGDLPDMRRVLRAAIRAGHIRSDRKVEFWVTEISWDTKPPDPGGVPLKLHARWVSEALYRMWKSRVTLVTWFQLRDGYAPDLPKSREYTSGLYFRCAEGLHCDKPKPALRAFRFPFVAYTKKRRIRFWGRTPAGVEGTVVIQQRRGGRWRDVRERETNPNGLFKGKVRTRRRGKMRAKGAGDRSQPFSLKVPREITVNPFGGCEGAKAENPVCPGS